MVAAGMFVLAVFILIATSSTMVIHTHGSPTTSIRLFDRFLFPDILVLVFLPMLIDYFNGCVRAHSLGIAAEIKIMGEPSLVYSGLWFCTYLWLPPRKYNIVSWKKKNFEDFENLLSFRL
jgi:hypothetical protein